MDQRTADILLPRHPRRPLTIADLPPCCQDKRNIIQFWTRADLRVTICQYCHHKYSRFFAEPGSLGAMLHG